MLRGNGRRKTGETAMNKDSSRSHSIFTIYIEQMEEAEGDQKIKAGKLHLVDLAGSERQSKTHATGDRLKEAQKINLSLSALGNVISALVDGKAKHIPYRDSKLTRLLQDSLGGNTKTVMIAALSPADDNYDETLSTLRYASRAKSIKNKPIINEDPKDALLREYEEEIKQLKDMLKQLSQGRGIDPTVVKKASNQLSDEIMFEDSISSLVEKIEKKGKKVMIIDENDEVKETKIDAEGHQKSLQDRITEIEENTGIKSPEGDSSDKADTQKEKLEKLVEEMEKKLVQRDHGLDDKERNKAKKLRKAQLALKKQKEQQQILMEQKLKEEEEKLFYEKQYKSQQEQFEENSKILNELRIRYKGALQEIKDLEEEHQNDHADLVNTVRDQQHELMLMKGMLKMILKDHEIEKV